MGRLSGKRALITGAGSGIGKQTALLFAAEGATVIAADIAGQDAVAEGSNGHIVPFRCDVSNHDDVVAMAAFTRETLGGLDILFNNAGIGRGGPRIHETPLADWDAVIAVNVRGAFLVLRELLPVMMESGGGSVINTSSTSAFKAPAGNGAYTPSKAAMDQLSKMAAIEYAKDGIRVNSVAPGPVLTPIYDGVDKEKRDRIVGALPIGRMGRPEEVANLVLFLASDEASFITGGSYVVDGGRLL